jgi:hypothetical protein
LALPKIKNTLKAQRFADIPDVQYNVISLQAIPENGFQDCFHQWHHHLMKCIASRGEYIEGNSSHWSRG